MADKHDTYNVGYALVRVDHGYVNRHDAFVTVTCGGEELKLVVVNQCGTENIIIKKKE
jgi:hypothetical protein